MTTKNKVVWTKEDSIAASKQGWCVFESVGDEVEFQLQREDEMEVFASDDDAAAFVKAKALEGDALAKKAIGVLIQSGSSDVKRYSLMAAVQTIVDGMSKIRASELEPAASPKM